MIRVQQKARSFTRRNGRRLIYSTLTVLVGALFLFHFGWEFAWVILAVAVAGVAATGFYRNSLEQKTRLISEASRMHLATVEALATAIDARDQIGKGHVRRTQIYAVGLGNILGLDENSINALRTGALLHDIGKLAVPDHILNKPGQLTAAEMEKTKIHSSVGASILEKVGFPYGVVPTVRYHHEFWDGNGYPEGLKGKNIPLTARILSIADAYDALREARPYRPARTKDEAVKFLVARSGIQYDPTLVDTFLRNLSIFEREIAAASLEYDSDCEQIGVQRMLLDDSQTPNYVEQIKQANREVFTLYSLAREFSSSLDLNETLELFSEKVADFVPFDSFCVSLLEPSCQFARTAYSSGLNTAIFDGRTIKVGEGATGYVLKKQMPVVNVDPALDLSFTPEAANAGYRVMASVPLFADDRMIGAVSLYSVTLPNFLDEHIRLVETISHIAGDAINIALQHAEAEAFALTDPMTELPNSRSLRSHFEKEALRAARGGSRFQLVVMDLDGFKKVNDTYGHKFGDLMLKSVGAVINSQLREYDFLARYGGDEFIAIVPETDLESIDSLHLRIAEAVEAFRLQTPNGAFANVGVSVGSATFPEHGESLDILIESADKAMYLAKAGNRRKNSIEKELAYGSYHSEGDSQMDQNGYEPLVIPEIIEAEIIASASAY